MAFLLTLAAVTYVIAAVFLSISATSFGLLLVLYLYTRHRTPALPHIPDDELLSVTVQLPVYNEVDVVARLIDACARLDYPADKLRIQVIDDSNDGTSAIIAERVRHWQQHDGPHIAHIRRPDRSGYKAGALAYGRRCVETDCVAVFDADFVPAPDFLRRTMPHFNADTNLGLIQTRWHHLNPGYNLLTRAQALSIDGHFVVEQSARSRCKLPMSMNGTGGIWRVAAIDDAGGWSADTLTEDLDLSYRALMRGWEFLYLGDVAVPGELPPQVQAYKVQQARWAAGSTECLVRHAGPLLTSSRFAWWKKVMGLLHLAQYAIQPVILLLFLLTPPLLWGGMFPHLPDLRPLTLTGLFPLLVILYAQIVLYDNWLPRLLFFPVQFMTAAAIAMSNSRAVIAVLLRPHGRREFRRTPKYHVQRKGEDWRRSRYTLRAGVDIVAEMGLSVYAGFGFALALESFPAFAPYMLVYALSFAFFAAWNLGQTVGLRRAPAQQRSRRG